MNGVVELVEPFLLKPLAQIVGHFAAQEPQVLARLSSVRGVREKASMGVPSQHVLDALSRIEDGESPMDVYDQMVRDGHEWRIAPASGCAFQRACFELLFGCKVVILACGRFTLGVRLNYRENPHVWLICEARARVKQAREEIVGMFGGDGEYPKFDSDGTSVYVTWKQLKKVLPQKLEETDARFVETRDCFGSV